MQLIDEDMHGVAFLHVNLVSPVISNQDQSSNDIRNCTKGVFYFKHRYFIYALEYFYEEKLCLSISFALFGNPKVSHADTTDNFGRDHSLFCTC
jgi:hypothetical protein